MSLAPHVSVSAATIALIKRLLIGFLCQRTVISTGDGVQAGRARASVPAAKAFPTMNVGRLAMPMPTIAASTRMVWRLAANSIGGDTVGFFASAGLKPHSA